MSVARMTRAAERGRSTRIIGSPLDIVNLGGRDWFIEMTKRFQESGAPPVSFALLMGSEFKAMAANQRRNLEENRIALIETVCRKR